MPKNLLLNGELVLYGPVGGDWWDDAGFTAEDVLHTLAEADGDLTVRINSGGGLAFDGLAIYNALKAYAGGKVTVHVDGIAASAASIIAMAGSERVMRGGALLMIHNASTIAWGQANDLEKQAGVLRKLDGQMAGIYARQTGGEKADIITMMDEETWLTGEQAVQMGFAHTTDDEEAATASAFDYRIYAKAPETLRAVSCPFPARAAARAVADATASAPPSAAAAAQQEVDMTEKTQAAPEKTGGEDKNTDARTLVAGVMARCRAASLNLEEAEGVVGNATSVDHASALILDIVVARQNAQDPEISGHIKITADAQDRWAQGVEKSLLAKANLEGGEVNEFSGLTLREIARSSLDLRGIKVKSVDPMAMVGTAFTAPTASHSTSDFPQVLSNIANKSMLKGFTEANTTYQLWTGKGNLSDFKTASRVDTGFFPALDEVKEGAEFTQATMSECGETYSLGTYGKLFKITRQAIINDDLGAFTRVPRKMGNAARRTVNKAVYALLIANPNMADSVALFHATHKNLASGAGNVGVTSDVYDKARAAMMKQKDGDVVIGIAPRYWIGPVGSMSTARQIFGSDTELGQANPAVVSKVAGMVEVIADAELDPASGTPFAVLAADPAIADTIEVLYLNGNENPALEQRDGWSIDGTEFKVRLDFGVKAFAFQGLYKVPTA